MEDDTDLPPPLRQEGSEPELSGLSFTTTEDGEEGDGDAKRIRSLDWPCDELNQPPPPTLPHLATEPPADNWDPGDQVGE